MDIGKSFSYPFEDKQWAAKLGLGGLIALVPILNFAWSGYMIEIVRRVVRNDPEPLPDWSDLGKKFMDGLMLMLAGLVYSLPMLILICLPLGFMILPGILAGSGDMQELTEVLAAAGGFLALCLSCLFVVYALALSVVYPAITVQYAREGTFAAFFQFREILAQISRNAGQFFTAWGVYLGAALGLGFVSGIIIMLLGWIPCLGQLVVIVIEVGLAIYLFALYAHLFGQFGRAAFEQAGDQTVR